MPHTPSAVLAVLDDAFEEAALPIPWDVYYPIAYGEISGFRADDEWLLLYQTVVFSNRLHEFDVNLSVFGSQVADPGLQAQDNVVMSEAGEPLWVETGSGSAEAFAVDLHDFSLRVRDSPVRERPSREDYAAAGVNLDVVEPPMALLLYLTRIRPELFLMPAEGVLERLGKTGLTRVFRTRTWQHPDIGFDEKPSTTPCFQAMAQSVVSGDPLDEAVCARNANNHLWSQPPD